MPILLTGTNTLPADVATGIDRLDVDAIYVPGGNGVVNEGVAATLAEHNTT